MWSLCVQIPNPNLSVLTQCLITRRFYACGVVTSEDEDGEEDIEIVVAGGRNATGALGTADIYSLNRNCWRSGARI